MIQEIEVCEKDANIILEINLAYYISCTSIYVMYIHSDNYIIYNMYDIHIWWSNYLTSVMPIYEILCNGEIPLFIFSATHSKSTRRLAMKVSN